MTLFYGLTGSIGMGKSTTADMFRKANIPVFDSDACVHDLYAGKAAPLIEKAFPGSTHNGVVDRHILSGHVIDDERKFKKLESIIHPLVHEEENAFRITARLENHPLAIFDHPLLFEMGREQMVDGIIVVTAPFEVQKQRVLARKGMSVEKFEALLKRQMPDSEKRKRADFIIDTSKGLAKARERVMDIIEKLTIINNENNKL